jgi:hypothetical protein
MDGFAIGFYDPNLYEVSYTLRLALDWDGQRQLVEGRGRGRSGQEAMLDLYAHLQALTAH